MEQRLYKDASPFVTQMYIQIYRAGNMRPAIFSYPCKLLDNTNLQKNVKIYPYDASPIYQVMQKKKEVVINYSNFDIGLNRTRVITIASPILKDNIFYGAIIWEQNLVETFRNNILPISFKEKKYPFIQFRRPEYPLWTQGAKSLKDVQKLKDKYDFEFNQ